MRERQPDAVVVLVVPPDRREQERRMRSRGDSENHIQQRLDAAEAEEQTGGSLADAVVLNEELQTAVAEIESIISAPLSRKIRNRRLCFKARWSQWAAGNMVGRYSHPICRGNICLMTRHHDQPGPSVA